MQIEVVTIAIGSLSALLTALVSYFVGRKKAKSSLIDSIMNANEQFRSEVRNDLTEARREIEDLRLAMKDKDKEIAELKTSMNDLRAEIVEKERKISDLKVDLVQKNIIVNELASRVSLLDHQK